MAYIAMNSDLKRKKWIREGLLQAKAQSFWAPFTGQGNNSVVKQVNNLNASEGHTVVFDYDGHLIGRAIKGKDTAFGKGEEKRKFSDKITVDRYRLVADNDDAFDAVDVGDLSLSQHEDSRAKLGDLFTRFKDQGLFDAAQGLLKGSNSPSHIVDFGTTFGYNQLIDLETTLRTSQGFSTGGIRRPLEPFKTVDGRGQWLFVIDAATAAMLKKNGTWQQIMQNADVRGNENRLINGVFGRVGQLLVVEAPNFFGNSIEPNAGTKWELDDFSVDIAGLRQKDAAGLWTGQPGFSYAGDLISRNLVLGTNALQIAFGKMPDYKFKTSQDFDIKSESALEVWMNIQKATLTAEKADYADAPMTNIDWGVVAVDIKTRDV